MIFSRIVARIVAKTSNFDVMMIRIKRNVMGGIVIVCRYIKVLKNLRQKTVRTPPLRRKQGMPSPIQIKIKS